MLAMWLRRLRSNLGVKRGNRRRGCILGEVGRTPNVVRLKRWRNVSGLVEELDHREDDFVRVSAAEALGEVGDQRAVEPLLDALTDESGLVAAAAAASLDLLDDAGHRVLPQRLIEVLPALPWQRWITAGPSCRVPVATSSDSRWTRQRRLLADESFVYREVNVAYVVRDHARMILHYGVNETHCPALIRLLRADHPEPRSIATEALLEIADPRVADVLLELFDNPPDEATRTAVAAGLGRRGDQRAIEPLKWWLYRTQDENNRHIAMRSIGQIGGSAAADFLLPQLSVPTYRATATAALGDCGDVRAISHLYQVFTDSFVGKDSSVRLAVVAEAIWKLGHRQVVPALCEMLAGLTVRQTRQAALIIEALGAIADRQVVPFLCEMMRIKAPSLAGHIAKALGAIGDPQAVPILCATLGTYHTNTADIAEALGVIGDPRAVPYLCKMLPKDFALGDERAFPDLMAVIKALERIGDRRALRALRRIPPISPVSEAQIRAAEEWDQRSDKAHRGAVEFLWHKQKLKEELHETLSSAIATLERR